MNKWTLIFILALTSPAFGAEWTQIGSSDSRDDYVDYEYLSNKKSKNNILKVWQLVDHKTVIANNAGTPVLSTKFLVEINCSQREARIAYIVAYSERKGKGTQLRAADPKMESEPIIPDSLYDVFRKTGCPA